MHQWRYYTEFKFGPAFNTESVSSSATLAREPLPPRPTSSLPPLPHEPSVLALAVLICVCLRDSYRLRHSPRFACINTEACTCVSSCTGTRTSLCRSDNCSDLDGSPLSFNGESDLETRARWSWIRPLPMARARRYVFYCIQLSASLHMSPIEICVYLASIAPTITHSFFVSSTAEPVRFIFRGCAPLA